MTLTKNSAESIILSWKKVPGATGYEIYRSTEKSSDYKLVKRITEKAVFTYTDTGLSKTVYYYKVRPYRTVSGKKVYGSWSAVKKIL